MKSTVLTVFCSNASPCLFSLQNIILPSGNAVCPALWRLSIPALDALRSSRYCSPPDKPEDRASDFCLFGYDSRVSRPSFLVYPMNFVQFTMTLPFSNFLTTPQRMFSLMLRLSSCARLLKMVMRISPVPSSVLIPSFSNTTATFFSLSFRILQNQ